MLYKLKRIFIESDDLRIKLMETYNFKNIDYFPNFRFTHDFDFIAMDDCKSDSEILKIVYVGRLIIDKGLDVIERFISYYVSNRDKFDKSVEIHFFGQFFDEKGKDYLTNVLCEHTCVFFHGELDPHLVCGVLKNFDLLVLPSRYPGEGSPGVINEAYMAGLPVIVSDWMYLSEFVIDGRTGFVFDLNKEIEFYNRIQELVNDTYLLDSMKENALAFSLSFNSRSAWDILYPYFGRPL
jgi:glycosyltransferase involved in cell wall biosynthesis